MTIHQIGLSQQPGQGDSYSVVGDVVTFKAVGEDTGGKYALFEIVVQPQIGPPPHIHHREDEAFYILEGEVEFHLDNQTIMATPGTFLHSPKGQVHSFINIGRKPAKMLCWTTPAGIEKFFTQVGIRVENSEALPPPITQATIERIVATAPEYGIEILPLTPDSSI
jgi:mannose-6-phosphate isomerase-like protein (cupin superfamily)